MNFFAGALETAIALLLNFDPEVVGTVWTSLRLSLVSIVLASLVGIPAGVLIALARFPGRRALIVLTNTLLALPTVVVGLVIYALLSRQGPLGGWGQLFTPTAMIVGQTVLAIPIVTHYSLAAISGADSRILATAQTLGGGLWSGCLRLLLEVRWGILAAVIAGFGRVIAEVGIAMMLGGNIRGYTRTMTTAIALETSKGEFAFALALGIVLMSVALIVNLFLNLLQQRES